MDGSPRPASSSPGDDGRFKVYFGNVLAPDRYLVTVTVERPGGAWMDRRERMFDIVVTGTLNTGALVHLPYDAAVHHVPGAFKPAAP